MQAKIKVTGFSNISADLIAHSKSAIDGTEIFTYELVYPRFIHSELMTHRLFSRNAASSRAIPIAKMIQQLRENPALPVHWGKNMPGMQAKEELNDIEKKEAIAIWLKGVERAIKTAEELSELGVHKQIANRGLEPYYMMKTVVTTTEHGLANWEYLRLHPDAQPEIYELARVMKLARDESVPQILQPGQWHLPYVDFCPDKNEYYTLTDNKYESLTLYDAIKISVSCCAQVSYRKNDTSLEKARDLFKRLVESKPEHYSPFEHQATPSTLTGYEEAHLYGNFKSWNQYRKYMELGENV